MKNKIAIFVMLAMAVSQVAFASSAMDKLKRGGEGLFTFPLQYCNEYHNAKAANENTAATIASTLFVGTFVGAKRIVNAGYDIVTFPLNWPKDYGLLLGDSYTTALAEYNARKK